VKDKLKEKSRRIKKLCLETERKKITIIRLIRELQKECPHEEVTETKSRRKGKKPILVMNFPVRKCVLCGLTESQLFGYQQLKDSTVVEYE